MRRGWGLVFGSAVLALLASPVSAELKHATVYRDHPVKGATARAVWQYMLSYPIIDPDDGPAFANITHDHKLTFKVDGTTGLCRVSNLTFQWNFVITLPKATDYGRMDAATKKMWNQFITYLKGHEEHHRDIFVACGKTFVPAAEKMTGLPKCFAMDRKVKAYVQKQYDLCMTKQRDFDHEEKQTVANLALVKAAAAAKLPGGSGF